MNAIRMIAMTLPMMLLMACGGGGGGGATAAAPTPMNTPDPMTGDPATPPTPTCQDCEALPNSLVTSDLDGLRTRFSGNAPTITDEAQIISGVQTTATTADTITMNDIVVPDLSGITGTPITPDCSANTSCTASIPNVNMTTFSLTDIEDLSLIDDTNLERFNSQTRAIMDVGDVKVIESRSAGLDDDGTRLAFQTYAGWLDGSVFGHRRIEVTEGSNATVYFASYSFGKASGSNPTGTSRITWNGVAVGVNRSDELHLQGTATIDIDDPDNPNVDVSIILRETITGFGTPHSWDDLPLTNGAFSGSNGFEYIEGSFYGDNHEEVGGIFRDLNLYGAFGATKD